MKKYITGGIRLNLFLFLIVAALSYIAIQKPGINKQVTYNKISQLNEEQIQHIEIISADNKKIRFIKKNHQWMFKTDNNETTIDPDKIGYLFKLLNADSLENFSASQEHLNQYHLSEPRITVKFDNFTIAFGDSEPLKRRRYILINKQVHLINDMYYHFLLQPANTYLSTTR